MTEQNTQTQVSTDRPTFTVTTSNGHEVVCKQWLTGREKRRIQDVFLEGMSSMPIPGQDEQAKERETSMQESSSGGGSFDPKVMRKAEEVTVEQLVVSVDGHADNILDRVLDMKETDTDEVVEAVNKVYSPENEEKK